LHDIKRDLERYFYEMRIPTAPKFDPYEGVLGLFKSYWSCQDMKYSFPKWNWKNLELISMKIKAQNLQIKLILNTKVLIKKLIDLMKWRSNTLIVSVILTHAHF
jgi:hypothetical protein